MTLFFSKHSLPPKMFSHLQRIRGTWGFSLGSKIRSTRFFSNIFCFGDALFCCKIPSKSWWWFVLLWFFGDDVFCFGLWTFETSINPIFWDKATQFLWGTVQTFQPCCQLVVGEKKDVKLSQVSWKKTPKEKVVVFHVCSPPNVLQGKKKTEFWNPTDLMVWFKTTVYIYISSLKVTAKAPGNSNGWKMMKFPFGLKGPFSGDLCC